MSPKCEHDIRETKRGAGPCRIEAEVKLRNGNPNWWCRTHGMAAGGPGGQPLESCPGSWLEPLSDDECLELDIGTGELAIWGAVAPAIEIGEVEDEPGKVHVHHRTHAAASKDIDASFEIVTLRNGPRTLVIEGMAAVACSISELAERAVTPLTCPHCGEVHIDELKFATFPHAKHLCNSCGRNFRDRQPSISNPLANAHEELGLPKHQQRRRPDRPLALASTEYAGIAVWPTNSALVSTMTRPEEDGLHVHAWDSSGELVIDETYAPVSIDGYVLDEGQVRLLAVQKSLAHGAPIIELACDSCGMALCSARDTWLEPSTRHLCECGHVNRTRLRSFVNPLVGRFPAA